MKNNMFLFAVLIFYTLYALLCIFSALSFCNFPLLSCQVQKGHEIAPLKMGAIETREPDG